MVALSAGAANRSPRLPPCRPVSRRRVPCVPVSRLPCPLRVPSVRAGLHTPLPVKAAERSGAPGGLGLDREGYTGCARTEGSFFLLVLIQNMSSTCIVLI